MGESTTNCMISGLPIPSGTETVVFFVTPAMTGHSSHRGGCYPWDRFQFASWPIFITMDDYMGFGDYFGSDKWNSNPETNSKVEELKAQKAWQIFWSQLAHKKESYAGGGAADPSDWARNLQWEDSGLYTSMSLSCWMNLELGEEPDWNEGYDSAILPVDFAYVRKDVWDHCINSVDNYDYLTKAVEQSCVRSVSIEDTIGGTNKEKLIAQFRVGTVSLPYGKEMLHDTQLNLLTKGEASVCWNKQTIFNIRLEDDSWEEIKKLTVDMFRFMLGMRDIGGWIHPSMSLSPRCDYLNKYCRDAYQSWTKFLQAAVESDIKAKDIDED